MWAQVIEAVNLGKFTVSKKKNHWSEAQWACWCQERCCDKKKKRGMIKPRTPVS